MVHTKIITGLLINRTPRVQDVQEGDIYSYRDFTPGGSIYMRIPAFPGGLNTVCLRSGEGGAPLGVCSRDYRDTARVVVYNANLEALNE